MTQQEILKKVKKLLALSQSDNANEAAQAAARAQELLDKYQLSRNLLDIDAADDEDRAGDDEPIFDFSSKGAPLDDPGTKMPRWRGSLATVVCRANSCRAYQETYYIGTKAKTRIAIVGRPSDVEKVRYLHAFLVREVKRLVDRDGQGCGITWRNNYCIGVVDTIRRELKLSKSRAADKLRRDAGGDMFALVRVDKALARLEKRSADVDAWVEANLKLGSVSGSSARGHWGARQAGQRAGKEIRMGGARGALGSGRKALTN